MGRLHPPSHPPPPEPKVSQAGSQSPAFTLAAAGLGAVSLGLFSWEGHQSSLGDLYQQLSR